MCVIKQFYKSLLHFLLMVNFRTLPVATISLIALNLLVFAFGFLTDSHLGIIKNFGFVPDSVFVRNSVDTSRQSNTFQVNPTSPENGATSTLIRLVSSMFIHSSVTHIVFNLAALAYIGGYSEKSIGTGRYLVIYFLSGICAALFHGVIASYVLGSGQTLLIGASGAISGVLGIGSCNWEPKSILLAFNSDSFCVRRFSNFDSHCIYCPYWRIFGRRNTNQNYEESRIVAKKRSK